MKGKKLVLISSSSVDEEKQLLDDHLYALSDGKRVWHDHEKKGAIHYVLLSQEMFSNRDAYKESIHDIETIIGKSDHERVICYLHRTGDQIQIGDLRNVIRKANKKVLPIKKFSHRYDAVSKHLKNFRD